MNDHFNNELYLQNKQILKRRLFQAVPLYLIGFSTHTKAETINSTWILKAPTHMSHLFAILKGYKNDLSEASGHVKNI